MATLRASSAAVIAPDAYQAAREACEQMLDGLGQTPDVVLVFASADLSPGLVSEGLWSRLPSSTKVLGATSDTEVDSTSALRGSVSVMGLSLSGLSVRTFCMERSADNLARGRAAASALGSEKPSAVLAFPDILESNGTQFLLGFQAGIGKDVPIVGGAPSDTGQFSATHTFHQRDVVRGGAVGLAFYGPLQIASAARSGYAPLGAVRTITRVDGAAILELDGRSALSVYREYLGERVSEMPASSVEFPIGVVGGALGTQRQSDGAVKLVRAIFGVDEARGALVLGGDLPEGALVRVLRATSADILASAREAAEAVRAAIPEPDLALVFSCSSRRTVLSSRYREECRAAFSKLPEDLPKSGFYTYGELSPLAGVTMHHESTFTIALLRAGVAS